MIYLSLLFFKYYYIHSLVEITLFKFMKNDLSIILTSRFLIHCQSQTDCIILKQIIRNIIVYKRRRNDTRICLHERDVAIDIIYARIQRFSTRNGEIRFTAKVLIKITRKYGQDVFFSNQSHQWFNSCDSSSLETFHEEDGGKWRRWNARKLYVPKGEGNGCAHVKHWLEIVARMESYDNETSREMIFTRVNYFSVLFLFRKLKNCTLSYHMFVHTYSTF